MTALASIVESGVQFIWRKVSFSHDTPPVRREKYVCSACGEEIEEPAEQINEVLHDHALTHGDSTDPAED